MRNFAALIRLALPSHVPAVELVIRLSVWCMCKVFEGNVDSYSVKHSYLDEPILARFVKFHTIHWNRHPSLRVELVGCQGNTHL